MSIVQPSSLFKINVISSSNSTAMNLELHVIIVIHRMWPKPSTAEITAATAAAAAVATSQDATYKHCSLSNNNNNNNKYQ